ncbi:hypothetical protein T492DRAFT_903390 [Pavlovales sp. CCMP2436]|nr:hypothetical protein T492DRAFT_903390 [Pavlovales sp. CCMP2436]|mmetsp:Transcript_15187/g.35311  ORF Transcript_15187/g.35311 Transcript_15187/m.35311 type:complete len:144 (+) Transcript_15187:825-1256(+)
MSRLIKMQQATTRGAVEHELENGQLIELSERAAASTELVRQLEAEFETLVATHTAPAWVNATADHSDSSDDEDYLRSPAQAPVPWPSAALFGIGPGAVEISDSDVDDEAHDRTWRSTRDDRHDDDEDEDDDGNDDDESDAEPQ